jgi:hypothetical protein
MRLNYEVGRGLMPIPPTGLIDERGFFFPNPLTTLGVEASQRAMDRAIAQDSVMKVEPGIISRVVIWDGRSGVVAGFSPEGKQVGYGHIIWIRESGVTNPYDVEMKHQYLMYFSSYIVGSEWTNKSIGTNMLRCLESYAVVHNEGVGASFRYDVQAVDSDSQRRAQRLLNNIGAIKVLNPNIFWRLVLKKQERNRRSGKQSGVVYLDSTVAPDRLFYSP